MLFTSPVRALSVVILAELALLDPEPTEICWTHTFETPKSKSCLLQLFCYSE